MENKRDLMKDLEHVRKLCDIRTPANTELFGIQAAFGWEHAITRALVAEKERDILLKYVKTKDCPFLGNDEINCTTRHCNDCIVDNCFRMALCELGMEVK